MRSLLSTCYLSFLSLVLLQSLGAVVQAEEAPSGASTLLASSSASSMAEETPIILRGPSSEVLQMRQPEGRAQVTRLVDNKTLVALSSLADWSVGEVLALESQQKSAGIIGFVKVKSVINNQDGSYELTCELMRQSRVNFIQIGDQLAHLDLSSENKRYLGTTDLIVRQDDPTISAKYKPLFTQGFLVGETAQTLGKNEYLVTALGQVNYGVNSRFTVNSVLPAVLGKAYNLAGKALLYDSIANVVAVGLSYATIPATNNSTLNLNIYWDSISSETTISHTFLSLALFSFENAADATVIKSLGTSSFQTGYEFVLDNWDRVLMGPSYNFEKKTVGGYLSYLKIWDQFHLSVSLNTTDVTDLKIPSENNYGQDGYYIFADAYYRF